jgi:hypothetical protein
MSQPTSTLRAPRPFRAAKMGRLSPGASYQPLAISLPQVSVFLVDTPVEIENGFSRSESTTSPKLSRYTFDMFGKGENRRKNHPIRSDANRAALKRRRYIESAIPSRRQATRGCSSLVICHCLRASAATRAALPSCRRMWRRLWGSRQLTCGKMRLESARSL